MLAPPSLVDLQVHGVLYENMKVVNYIYQRAELLKEFYPETLNCVQYQLILGYFSPVCYDNKLISLLKAGFWEQSWLLCFLRPYSAGFVLHVTE